MENPVETGIITMLLGVIAFIFKRWLTATKDRALFVNGKKDEIILALNNLRDNQESNSEDLRARIVFLAGRLARLEQADEEANREHSRLWNYIHLLEEKLK